MIFNLIFWSTLAFVLALLTGRALISFLKKRGIGQYVRDDGPSRHLTKAGTPTFGGFIFLLPLVLVFIFNPYLKTTSCSLFLFLTLGFAFVGFIDDYLKVIKKRSLGLKARQKILLQLILSFILWYYAVNILELGTKVSIPYFNVSIELGLWYLPLVLVIGLGASNAVNLTDGLDGLAGGLSFFVLSGYTLAAFLKNENELGLLTFVLTFALLGFLFYNVHPAKIFMGDTGSMALGGALGIVAVLTKTEFLLPIFGLVFVLEALSVILQVSSFKLRGKRILRMSPLHHHLELGGWSEWQVVLFLWALGLVSTFLGIWGI